MPTDQRQYHPIDDTCDGRCTREAIGLCLSSPVAWSMTPHQIRIFRQLCNLQMEEGGLHSLLPNVMAELLALARQPWWDPGVAGLPDECPGERRVRPGLAALTRSQRRSGHPKSRRGRASRR